jgi:hypothetical protein
LQHPPAPTVSARDRSYSRSSTGTPPVLSQNPQVEANQGALVIPIRKGLEQVDVERSVFIVNHNRIVAAEVGGKSEARPGSLSLIRIEEAAVMDAPMTM